MFVIADWQFLMTYSYTVKNMDNFKKETIGMLIKFCLKKTDKKYLPRVVKVGRLKNSLKPQSSDFRIPFLTETLYTI